MGSNRWLEVTDSHRVFEVVTDLPPTPTSWPPLRRILRALHHPTCAPFLAVETLVSSHLFHDNCLGPSSPP